MINVFSNAAAVTTGEVVGAAVCCSVGNLNRHLCTVMLRHVTVMTKGDDKCCSPRRCILTAARRSFLSKCPAALRYRRTRNCIHVHKKRTADCPETHLRSTASCADLLHRIQPEQDKSVVSAGRNCWDHSVRWGGLTAPVLRNSKLFQNSCGQVL